MTIKVVTDSTSDLPDTLIKEYDITVVPVYINIEGQSYLDGVEISHAEFYNRLPDLKTPPTTSAPGIDSFARIYKDIMNKGASEIISIHAAGDLSNIFNVAKMASETLEPQKIAVVDSRSTSLGLGFQSIIAARAAQAGRTFHDIIKQLSIKIKHTYLYAALDTVDYLRRSGRASTIKAGLSSLLNIKPVISLHDSKLSVHTIRTRTRAVEKMVAMVNNLCPLEFLAVAHTNALNQAEELCRQVVRLLPDGEEPIITEATPALGTHVGPGALGLLCISAKQD